MLRTWTAGALGCALVLGVGCAETDRSLGNLGQGNDDKDGGSGGSATGAGGDETSDAGETSAGGKATGSGGSATGSGGRMTGSGGARAAGGTHPTAGSGGAVTGGSGGAPQGGAGGAATGGSGGELAECTIDCQPGDRKKLAWGADGGEVAYVDSSEIAPCSTRYYHYRLPGFVSMPEASCYSFMPVCYPALSPVKFADVFEALGAPEVQAALAQSGTVFGVDPRPYDGTVFMVRYGDAVFYVGDPCTPVTVVCKQIPPAIAALEKVLKDLDAQELARGDCLSTFPPR